MSAEERMGFILAGGHSSRMGAEKALLPIKGRLLIEWIIQRLRPAVDRICLIANPRNIEDLRVVRADAWITDLAPDRGPLMGVYTGLMWTDTPLNVFVACDMPGIESPLIGRLLSAWRPDLQAVASRGEDGQVYPLPMVCHRRAVRAVGALLDRGEPSLRALMRGPQTQLIDVQDGSQSQSQFTNVNTMADYRRLTDEQPLPFRR